MLRKNDKKLVLECRSLQENLRPYNKWVCLQQNFCISIHINQLTYLLTPYSIVLLEKLTGFQLVKKLPAFYRTRRFITVFTSARHLRVYLS